MLACTALVGCNNDDVVENNEVNKQGKDYMAKVSIVIPADVYNSRAAKDPNTEDFAAGTEQEKVIKTAHFAFYTADGDFLTLSQGVLGTPVASNPSLENKTVEQSVEVYIEANTAPSKVVAFLNAPSTLSNEVSGKSLSELKEIVWNATSESGTVLNNLWDKAESNGTGFLMTNSSYKSNNDIIVETTFSAQEMLKDVTGFTDAQIEDLTWKDDELINIYVERVASKVQVTATKLANSETVKTGNDVITQNEKDYYIIPSTNINDAIAINIVGWGLNATNKDFKLVKTIETTWTNSWYGDVRSYWGIDNNYNTNGGVYLTGDNFIGENQTDYPENLLLNHITYSQMTNAIGNPVDYCAPNTVNSNPALNSYTTVAVAAKYCKYDPTAADGSKITELKENEVIYSIDNKIYTGFETPDKNDLLTEIANRMYVKGGFYYVGDANSTTTTITEENKIKASDLKIVAGTSYNKHAFTKGTIALAESTKKLYKLDESASTPTYEEADLPNVFMSSDILIYPQGICYYQIPIRQFPATTTIDSPEDLGYYGVVRNHWYVIDITKIEELGSPTTPDAPTFDDGDDTTKTYAMKAKVMSLPWATVNQDVTLKK